MKMHFLMVWVDGQSSKDARNQFPPKLDPFFCQKYGPFFVHLGHLFFTEFAGTVLKYHPDSGAHFLLSVPSVSPLLPSWPRGRPCWPRLADLPGFFLPDCPGCHVQLGTDLSLESTAGSPQHLMADLALRVAGWALLSAQPPRMCPFLPRLGSGVHFHDI